MGISAQVVTSSGYGEAFWLRLLAIIARTLGRQDKRLSPACASEPPVSAWPGGRALPSVEAHFASISRPPRDRKFADSPPEGDGFELPVRGRGQSGCRPFGWAVLCDRVRSGRGAFWHNAVSAT